MFRQSKFTLSALKCVGLVLLSVQLSVARWANYDDAVLEYDFINATYQVNKEGTYTSTTEVKAKLLKEAARESFAKLDLPGYNRARGRMEVLEAKTIDQGITYSVPPHAIEDNPVLAQSTGFDARNQISIAFPKLEIGASVYLKLKYVETTPAIPDQFSMLHFFGEYDWNKAGCVQITSEIPLYFKINDPYHVLSIEIHNKQPVKADALNKEETVRNVKVCIKKAFTNAAVSEVGPGVVSPEKLTWVSVSTMNHWNDIAHYFTPRYEQVISQTLPEIFAQAIPLIKSASSITDAMNEATNYLAQKIHYMGDWRTVAGGFVPRELSEIAKTQSGDCKDFAVSLGAILRKAGYQANIAMVNRGWLPQAYPYLPSENAFNHAIVKVTAKNGDIYWVDPTNYASMSQMPFVDIADRMTLVLDAKNPSYEKIPSVDPASAFAHMDQVLSVMEGGKLLYETRAKYAGQFAVHYTGWLLYQSEQQIKDQMYYQLSAQLGLPKNQQIDLQLPDLKSRIVKELIFTAKYWSDQALLKSNIGEAIQLKQDQLLEVILMASKENIGDLYIGPPRSYRWTTTIKDRKYKDLSNIAFKVVTPWIEIERKAEVVGEDTKITDNIVIKHGYLPNDFIQSPEFIALQTSLRKDYSNVLLIRPLVAEKA